MLSIRTQRADTNLIPDLDRLVRLPRTFANLHQTRLGRRRTSSNNRHATHTRPWTGQSSGSGQFPLRPGQVTLYTRSADSRECANF